jgi:hypothetical protein
MVFVSIPSSQYKKEIHHLNQHIRQGKPAFVLIYMEGCGPCNATRPEWGKLKNTLSLPTDSNIMITDVDQEVLPLLSSIKESPMGFPTMLYIRGNQIENFENGRDVDSFVQWIKGKNISSQKGGSKMKMSPTKKEKKNRKISIRKTKKNRRVKGRKGGEANNKLGQMDLKLNKFQIANTDIILFLIQFLGKTDLKNILLSNYNFINSLENRQLDFKQDREFRKFINDIVQWFLLDYDRQFFNSLLEIVIKTLENPDFLNNEYPWSIRYGLLLLNVYQMLEFYNNKEESIDTFILLQILLRLLRMPKVEEIITKNIDQQQTQLINYRNTIVCLLDTLIKQDLLHNPNIRELIKEFIEELTYNHAYDWSTFSKLTDLIKKCSFKITKDLSSVAATKVYNSTLGKLFKAK